MAVQEHAKRDGRDENRRRDRPRAPRFAPADFLLQVRYGVDVRLLLAPRPVHDLALCLFFPFDPYVVLDRGTLLVFRFASLPTLRRQPRKLFGVDPDGCILKRARSGRGGFRRQGPPLSDLPATAMPALSLPPADQRGGEIVSRSTMVDLRTSK